MDTPRAAPANAVLFSPTKQPAWGSAERPLARSVTSTDLHAFRARLDTQTNHGEAAIWAAATFCWWSMAPMDETVAYASLAAYSPAKHPSGGAWMRIAATASTPAKLGLTAGGKTYWASLPAGQDARLDPVAAFDAFVALNGVSPSLPALAYLSRDQAPGAAPVYRPLTKGYVVREFNSRVNPTGPATAGSFRTGGAIYAMLELSESALQVKARGHWTTQQWGNLTRDLLTKMGTVKQEVKEEPWY